MVALSGKRGLRQGVHALSSRQARLAMRPLDVVRELARRVSQDRIPLSALIVIGSAAREGDFVEGLSDIDVVVVQDEPDPEIEDRIRAIASEVDPAISLVILDRARLGSIFRAADALSFLIKAGTPLVIDGPTRRIVRQAVRPTGATVWRLRASARAALRLAFEAHYARDYKRAIVHAYHALRHAIRAQAAAKGAFPVSDAEVLEAAEGDRVKAAYGLLVSLRRNYKSAAKNPPLVRNAVVLSDRLVDLLTGAG
ncbi:TPA: nucleotidyltransferase domain-containing protein, partial [Candidatus Bathyarchaeota archaeon]|nr:nucleotidyltransferase domain-containing protein [Candidatus Bathyarchaeota archaeon]